MARQLQALRFDLLKKGEDIQRFHATEDSYGIKESVFSVIGDGSWWFASVVVQKNKVFESLRNPAKFYPQFASYPLRFVLRGRVHWNTTGVLIYTDTIPIDKNRRAVEKAVKQACSADLPKGLPSYIYHHVSASNCWLQVTDYACWAVQRKWEHGDLAPYTRLQARLAKLELDVLERGTEIFY